DIMEADIVFTSSMIVQKKSLEKVIKLVNKLGKPVVAGGPYPTSSFEKISGVDHFVLNEAEATLPQFLEDSRLGKAKHLYMDKSRPDITATPIPRFDLLNLKLYSTMALQYSRGCPFACEFCDIIEMFGRHPRTKTPAQFLAEVQSLYNRGYRGALFIVDDNFIGNKKNVKQLLPRIAAWQKAMHYPFSLFTEASVDLASDEELMDMMVQAGFDMVFLGIETPVKESLALTHKNQNLKCDLLQSVHTIQKKGMEVAGGFILGFDNDPEDIFERQVHFIQKAGIPAAMVGLLTALPNTRLYHRLKSENRLIEESAGNNNNEVRLNFLPKMDMNKLLTGYREVIAKIYKPELYFQRCLSFLKNLKPQTNFNRKISYTEVRAFILSLLVQTFSFYGWHYWKFLITAIFTKPSLFGEAVAMAIKGHHFLKLTREVLAADNFKAYLEKISGSFQERIKENSGLELEEMLKDLTAYRKRVSGQLQKKYRRLHKDFRPYVEEALINLEKFIDNRLAELSASSSVPQRVKILEN
ncbi:MAG: B12-binding domain-containing radical SAM protein, partial [Candidatus Tectomicrobia bacterium]|nr:B12-binding domain-containing radical SAM protein [Candidatus Tectomicrobia bacterium]